MTDLETEAAPPTSPALSPEQAPVAGYEIHAGVTAPRAPTPLARLDGRSRRCRLRRWFDLAPICRAVQASTARDAPGPGLRGPGAPDYLLRESPSTASPTRSKRLVWTHFEPLEVIAALRMKELILGGVRPTSPTGRAGHKRATSPSSACRQLRRGRRMRGQHRGAPQAAPRRMADGRSPRALAPWNAKTRGRIAGLDRMPHLVANRFCFAQAEDCNRSAQRCWPQCRRSRGASSS